MIKQSFFRILFLSMALLVGFATPDRSIGWAALAYGIGYSVAFYLILSRYSRIWMAGCWGFCVGLIQMAWVATPHYHGYGIVVVYLILSLIYAVQFALTMAIGRKKGSFCAAAVWVLFEATRPFYFFPFSPIGLALTFHPIPMQLAAVFGVYGLSFWVIWQGFLGASFLNERSFKKSIYWASVAIFPFVFGYLHMTYHEKQLEKAHKVDVLLVQTGLSIEQKWSFDRFEDSYLTPLKQWERVFTLLEGAVGSAVKLIVLPEVALPGDAYEALFPYKEVMELFPKGRSVLAPLTAPLALKKEDGILYVTNAWICQSLSNYFHSELIVGLLDSEGEDVSFNAAFHFVPFRVDQTRYDKRVLVPLTECLPFPLLLKGIANAFGINTFFTEGKESKVFNGHIPISVSICFEEGFGQIVREGRLKGAEMLVNISNDEWFPKSRLHKEHFNLGRVRAVENGAPVVRCCNTGITGAIDSLGNVVFLMKDIDLEGNIVRGIGEAQISSYTYFTLFMRGGNYPILLLSLGVVLFYSVDRKKRIQVHFTREFD